MEISRVSSGAGASGAKAARDTDAAVGVLYDRSGGSTAAQQLGAYTAVADRWRGAREPERAALAQALTESPFGQKVNATLNSFTRAAWPGADAAPPAPQVQSLAAFDKLPDESQQIVAAMQVDPASGARFASAAAYRSRLAADVEAATGAARKPDTVTLSDEARAFLANGQAQEATAPAAPRPDLGAMFDAYAKAGR